MDMKELAEVTTAALKSAQEENRNLLKAAQEKTDQAIAEVKAFGTITTETNVKLTELNEKSIEAHKRLLDLEQKMATRPGLKVATTCRRNQSLTSSLNRKNTKKRGGPVASRK